MFRDLRGRVSARRQALAWSILVVGVGVAAFMVPRLSTHPTVVIAANAVAWAAVSYLVVRLLTFLLLDPLLRQRETETPGFARDLIVFTLYLVAAGGVLREILGVSVGQLLGTGAIAAAVVGLSLQETLGNLFAGISLHLDPNFQVGDWVEISGNVRGGSRRETFIGQVESLTWRTVQLRTEDGDTDIFPNRVIAQAIVTNLYAPSGLHRRTAKVVVEPGPELHVAIAKLTRALGGLPHYAHHPPEVVVQGLELGGAVLEARFWTLGFRHGRQATYQAQRLMATVLPREGFCLMGIHGITTSHPRPKEATEAMMGHFLEALKLPDHWREDLRRYTKLHMVAPGEGVILEGESGDSIFAIIEGQLDVVHVQEREVPYNGLFWEPVARLGPGQVFGEHSLLTGAPRNATVISTTSAILLELGKTGVEEALRKEPEVMHNLAALMAARDSHPSLSHKEAAHSDWLGRMKAWFSLD